MTDAAPTSSPPHDAFADMAGYQAIPRVTGLAMSVDGSRLVAAVSALNDDGDEFVNSLWSVDPAGGLPARRLTWSQQGESAPVFAPDGSLLFTSKREADDDDPPALWQLPPDGGEARRVLQLAGGVAALAVARLSGDVVVATPRLQGSTDEQAERQRRQRRKDVKTSAILHEVSPIRFWDHDLGPDEVHLVATDRGDDGRLSDRDLTPAPQRALDEQAFTVAPDGRTVVTGWAVDGEPGFPRPQLVAVDTSTGEHRVLATDPGGSFSDPDVSADGTSVVCWRVTDSSYDEASSVSLHLVDLASAERRDVLDDVDLSADAPRFSADGSAVFFTADDHGHRAVFRVDLSTGERLRLTADGHYTTLCVHPDGRTLFALRDHVDAPPAPVRLDATRAGEPVRLDCPGRVGVPGRVEDVETTVADGTTVRSFLVMPDGASPQHPAPLVLWIHGGPHGSWNSWSWRWNPWLLVARGYAVLLPDPALSTGYGRDMVQRGWGQWGGTPYTDLMAATDAVVARADVDEQRTAAMGGSYGGYMANWVAGHTGRFRCIVTHASLWALDQFQGTTDHPAYWAREWGLPMDRPQRYDEWSPHHFAADITTPMLVIHGDKDYRVPVGEGMRLWWDLQRHGVESKYLYFPDEGHWILKPGNARVWYETVWAWLARHVLGDDWERPDLL